MIDERDGPPSRIDRRSLFRGAAALAVGGLAAPASAAASKELDEQTGRVLRWAGREPADWVRARAGADHNVVIVGDKPPPATGPVPMSLYSPKIAAPINELNGFLRYNGDLSPRHTEVAILVATREIEQQYEYSSHEPAALRFGAPQEVIDTIKYNREPKDLSPEETLIIKLGRDLMRKHAVDSETYAQAVKLFGKKGVVELVTVMGDYVMVGMVLTAIDQHLPPDRPPLLPPRGTTGPK